MSDSQAPQGERLLQRPGARSVIVKYTIPYETKWGEVLVLTGSRGLLGAGEVDRGLKMHCSQGPQGLVWEVSVTVPEQYECSYTYVVVNEHVNKVVSQEAWPHTLRFPRSAAGSVLLLADKFQAASSVETLYKRTAFRDVIFGHKHQIINPILDLADPGAGLVTVRFCITDFTLTDGKTICVYGDIAELGNWQESRGVRLTEACTPTWVGHVTVPAASFPFTYKYFVCNAAGDGTADGRPLEEGGDARVATLGALQEGDEAGDKLLGPCPGIVCQNDGHLRHKRPWQGSGLAVPVFSLRTRDSVGCGEFLDIKAMVDFVAACGMRVLQVLPVNDTRVYGMWWDSYPYSAISVFALHPLYLSLSALVAGPMEPALADEIAAARVRNDHPAVDYETTLADKLRIARRVYEAAPGRADLESGAFKAWLQANEAWLQPYAAFCFLRDLTGTADHREWGCLGRDAMRHVTRVTRPGQEWHATIRFTYWLQWHLHKQLQAAASHAARARVVLKGDLPIGVAKASADTWLYPHLFRMDVGVGSPPDAFDPKGQNWGFPGYNWEEMAKDGYHWWRTRLEHMAQYFTAYRVDHILGFFRVYEVPERHVTGALGHFRPSRPLTRKGLEAVGLWDLDRLCEPHVTAALVREHFGELAEEVEGTYLERTGGEALRFKAAWDCERALARVTAPAGSPDWLVQKQDTVRTGLMALLGNVILLRDDADAAKFYPRFQLMQTASFAAFDASKHALLTDMHDGYFYRNHDTLWSDCARRTLPALQRSTDMLMCGEDLGFVPACVPPVLRELGVVGLRIQRMPAVEAPEGAEFGDPALYTYTTVASPSCHDTSTTRAWYEEDEARRERFYYRCLEGTGDAPAQCTPGIMNKVAHQHLMSPAIFCILPLQDWLALSEQYYTRTAQEETINDPTNPRHYWRYRMQPCVEDLLEDQELLVLIQNLNLVSNRASLDEIDHAHPPPSGSAQLA